MYTGENISVGVLFKSPECYWTEIYIAGITHFIYTSFGHVGNV
jgi:hypothetical protein